MKDRKIWISAGIAGLCMLMACSLYYCSSIETTVVYYASKRGAQEKGAINAGWVPDWLPASAYDISEAHNIDTNESILLFRYKAGDDFYIRNCIKIDREKIIYPSDRMIRLFKSARRIITDRSFGLFECKGGGIRFLMLKSEGSIAVMWSLGDNVPSP